MRWSQGARVALSQWLLSANVRADGAARISNSRRRARCCWRRRARRSTRSRKQLWQQRARFTIDARSVSVARVGAARHARGSARRAARRAARDRAGSARARDPEAPLSSAERTTALALLALLDDAHEPELAAKARGLADRARRRSRGVPVDARRRRHAGGACGLGARPARRRGPRQGRPRQAGAVARRAERRAGRRDRAEREQGCRRARSGSRPTATSARRSAAATFRRPRRSRRSRAGCRSTAATSIPRRTSRSARSRSAKSCKSRSSCAASDRCAWSR